MVKARNKRIIFSLVFSSLVVHWFHVWWYFVIFVFHFELIVVIPVLVLVIFKKLFSHRSHVSLLIPNLVHQPVRVFHGHYVKVNLNKRLIHSINHVQAQQHVPYRSRSCVHRNKRFSSSTTRHSLLILELSQEFISLIGSRPP